MGRQLHHRKEDDKYALYSTVVDGYVTDWEGKEKIKQILINYKIKEAKEQVEAWMKEIDKEV